MNTNNNLLRAGNPSPKFDPLQAYADWFMRQPFAIPPVPCEGGVTRVGSFSGVTLHRSGQFQTQMWSCDPQSSIPDHRHPNVDSIQVFVTGELALRVNGKPALNTLLGPSPGCEEILDPNLGYSVRVGPNDTHGAAIGPRGAVFLTFQQWKEGFTPQSVEQDWEGEPIDAAHGIAIGRLKSASEVSVQMVSDALKTA